MAFWNKIGFGKKNISVSSDIIDSLNSANIEQLKEICENKYFFLDPNFRTKLSERCHHLLDIVKPIHKENVDNPKKARKLTAKAVSGIINIQLSLKTLDAMNKLIPNRMYTLYA